MWRRSRRRALVHHRFTSGLPPLKGSQLRFAGVGKADASGPGGSGWPRDNRTFRLREADVFERALLSNSDEWSLFDLRALREYAYRFKRDLDPRLVENDLLDSTPSGSDSAGEHPSSEVRQNRRTFRPAGLLYCYRLRLEIVTQSDLHGTRGKSTSFPGYPASC